MLHDLSAKFDVRPKHIPIARIRDLKPRISVIGIGGAGCNAVARAIQSGLRDVDYIVISSDAQALVNSPAGTRIQLPRPEVTAPDSSGRSGSFNHVLDQVRVALQGCHLCFIIGGMGGQSAGLLASKIAEIARSENILTVGAATLPFAFEGKRRLHDAEKAVATLRGQVDSLIVIPNQNLATWASDQATLADSFGYADDVLVQAVRSIVDPVVMPGLVNLNFSDLRTVLEKMGQSVLSTGEASGEGRAIRAAERAVNAPLLEGSIRGARHLVFSVIGNTDMRLAELEAAAEHVTSRVHPDAQIVWGSAIDPDIGDAMRVSIIATGISPPEVMRISPRRKGACLLRKHKPAEFPSFNQGFHFSHCTRCACQLVRSAERWVPVPPGFRVVWRAQAHR